MLCVGFQVGGFPPSCQRDTRHDRRRQRCQALVRSSGCVVDAVVLTLLSRDVEAGEERLTLPKEHKDVVASFTWNEDGSQVRVAGFIVNKSS